MTCSLRIITLGVLFFIIAPLGNLFAQQILHKDLTIEGQQLSFRNATETKGFYLLDGDTLYLSAQESKAVPIKEEGIHVITTQEGPTLTHISRKGKALRYREIPFWLSIVPPLLAIGLALVFKEVITSLMIGIWSGVFILGGLRIESIGGF